ncbi:MAG: RDD family protein, partial [Chloroflexota bacterium]|nr:RDD family protein [Chloroflexota bacterium]
SAPPPAQPVAGASGFVYADVPNRAIAYIIDAIILFVINIIIGLVIGSFLPTTSINPNPTGFNDLVTVNYVGVLVSAVVSTLISGAYFIYTWTAMRGSVGQKLLGMQVGNFPDGATLKQDQAIRRWIFLGAPLGLLSALTAAVGPALGAVIGLLGLAYFIYLLVTTAQSPTKQGFHDKQANTVVVKAARSVG